MARHYNTILHDVPPGVGKYRIGPPTAARDLAVRRLDQKHR
jgi:hypothetical protein